MKQLFASLAVLALCSTAAFAQESDVILPSQIAFSPYDEDGEFLPSTESTIHVTMDAVPSVPVTIMYYTGNGFGMDVKYETRTVTDESFDINLTTANWGLPYDKVYYLNLVVTFTHLVDGEIEFYPGADGEPVAFSAMYITPDTGNARWAINYPNERNWEEEGLTFSRFYNMGECYFYFTKAVDVPSQPGYIVYTDKNGVEEEVDIEDYSASWDEGLGLYAVSVNIKNDAYTAASLKSIEVFLEGVEDEEGQEISVPSILATNSVAPQATPRKVKSIEKGMLHENEGVNIYNVQGMLIKENVSANAVNELPAGLYIVNGKKVVVR